MQAIFFVHFAYAVAGVVSCAFSAQEVGIYPKMAWEAFKKACSQHYSNTMVAATTPADNTNAQWILSLGSSVISSCYLGAGVGWNPYKAISQAIHPLHRYAHMQPALLVQSTLNKTETNSMKAK